ncbi:O-succinylhomoserine sulfhydrylase [Commensalibacter communis]|uniref:O-succinylhomoserine sulfhydrylase n=1 Tax=Commensalibacter communis TaxID=2972786 RepID=UPI0022FFAC61|nr:O-succinylhomoserine sulfhydrylase [Commensalibacter communis]CAI3938042.1 Cystathionine beta-lyase/cystathionine gamma-synthase (MetC) (PDB:1CL1) [Commensalibacter communis]CAI3940198.1 Cystathionine beta-lyase/cystathionine gamma-synthase (MetC) (PDB:1CL1) [Commensalibacter communis]
MKRAKNYRPATQLIHGGVNRTSFDETSDAVFLTSGFIYDSAEQAELTFKGEADRYQYSRFNNPNLTSLENRLSELEGAEACALTSTGMSAIYASLIPLVKSGDRVVASRALFGSSYWIIENLLPQMGVETIFVDGTDLQQWEQALSKPTAAVLIETPSNPMLDILDIQAIAELTHRAGGKLIVDNVFATPLYQHPLQWGADIVVYSCTKHIDGQGRVLGGAVLGNKSIIQDHITPFVRNTGIGLSPFNAWVLFKGLETLPLRVEKMTQNALACAEFLEKSEHISRVLYPGLKSHPHYDLGQKQMSASSTMIGFEIKGGKKAAFTFMNALELILLSNNLGDSRCIVTHPATTTHMKIGEAERLHLGITDGSIRFSVGIEDIQDIIEDLQQGLDAVAALSNTKK